MSLDANTLRRTFLDYFVERGHTLVPSSSLILPHPTAPMFANAGMNQFVEYLAGEVPAPYPSATSVQKCVRLSGKHNDIAELGRTRRHLSFFEMLGNWSFGDYFKEEAIAMAWDLSTRVAGFDGDRIWVTVHLSDDEAEAIWIDKIGLPAERIQRLDKDNFWEMGEVGPCGPCSELHYDCGPEWGDAGGPARGGGDRYVEFWNLVFMDRFRDETGALSQLARKNIDTGVGVERWLMLVNDLATVFDTDALRPLIATAESITGRTYRGGDARVDTALRVVGDHARTMTFIVNDGVSPSNEGRGYVLRGVIRRAVRLGHQLGVDRPMCADLVAAAVESMGEAYPELRANAEVISDVVEREEGRFRTTLKTGSSLLEDELSQGKVSGSVAFALHDTFGFPIEITEEIAQERGVPIERAEFDRLMTEQRRRSRDAGRATSAAGAPKFGPEAYRELLSRHGPTEFTGYTEAESKGTVLAVLPGPGDGQVEVFVDRTPFYAEGGGQVGDTGTITSPTGTLRVLDTTPGLPGLHRHLCVVEEGTVEAGQEVTASIDVARRDAIRRNHTGTHMLHWALREVLGPHVKQHGSLVDPGYLRFDFSHHGALTDTQLGEVERLANERILANEAVRAYETGMAQAKQLGAIMFFGDKYGDVVRVVEAGSRSMELCGGTHVNALGMIGPVKITQETSIGANLRRIFALTGEATLSWVAERERLLAEAAALTKSKPEEVPAAIERLQQRQRDLESELKATRARMAAGEGKELAVTAAAGLVVARRDGLSTDQLRDLAVSVRTEPGVRAAVLVGSPDGSRVAIAAAVAKDSGLVAGTLAVEAARVTGGGGNAKAADVATAGGRDVARIDEALAAVRALLAP